MLNNPHLLMRIQQRIDTMIRGSILRLGFALSGEDAPLIGAALLLDVSEETILN